jgi:hypothetical protein
VAANAAAQLGPQGSWLTGRLGRWLLGGALVAGAAGLLLLGRSPAPPPGPQLAALGNQELLLAQRLDLYEDLGVVQDQEALEEFELVAVLHELKPEGKP